jgi:Tfp pilus assembly protein PilO
VSPLLKRIVSEKRGLLVPVGIALVVNLVAYVFVVRPRGVKAAGAANRAVIAAADLRSAEREQATARALVTGKARADEELSAFYDKVLPADQEAARRMTYSSLPALARKSGVTWARRTSEVEQPGRPEKDQKLGHMVISMVLQGSYEDFRAFIYALESAPEFLIVDDVQLTQAKPNEPLTFIITMSTYFRVKGNGA